MLNVSLNIPPSTLILSGATSATTMKLFMMVLLAATVQGRPEPPVGSYSTTQQDAFAPPPIYTAPSTTYLPSGPSSTYEAPSSAYGVPLRPSSTYGAPSSAYGAPSSAYGAPSSNYRTPSSSYRAPSRPSSTYGTPSSTYGTPSSAYGAPNAISKVYGAPSLSSSSRSSFKTNLGSSKLRTGVSRNYLPAQTSAVFKPSSTYGAPSSAHGGYHQNQDDLSEPAMYQFAYTVMDATSGNDFGHREGREGEVAWGSYEVLLPDGRKQIVEYEADETGYRPKIRYEQPGYAAPRTSGGPY